MPEEPIPGVTDPATVGAPSPVPYRHNPRHTERITDWIHAKWNHGPCPVCQSDSYETGAVHEVPAYAPVQGLPVAMVPFFSVYCTVCGYTIWVNAVIAKVVRTDEDNLRVYEGGREI